MKAKKKINYLKVTAIEQLTAGEPFFQQSRYNGANTEEPSELVDLPFRVNYPSRRYEMQTYELSVILILKCNDVSIRGDTFFAEEEEEVAVSEVRTVVRTERHVYDSEDGERSFDTGGF